MSGTMDHARKAIYNMFGGEPLSYTRFSLARHPGGDNSHVEMKLSSEEEDGGENGMIDHVPMRSAKPRNKRCYLYLAALCLLILLVGMLMGYLSVRGQLRECSSAGSPCLSVAPACAESLRTTKEIQDYPEPEPEPVLYWADLKEKLSKKLSSVSFQDTIRQISSSSHEAGSVQDDVLANYVHSLFEKFNLDKVWNDEHYVRLQVPGSLQNSVFLDVPGQPSEPLEKTPVHVAYSESATVSGKPVYANYGRKEDFANLSQKNIPLNGSVVLVRAGKLTFAEKVANAKTWNALGVLIYPDPADYLGLADNMVPFGHAHLGLGDPFTPGFPSFNHTQFPPVESSGLPRIPVQTISNSAARRLFSQMNGQNCDTPWKGNLRVMCKLGSVDPGAPTVRLQVNNVLVEKRIVNVFSVIKGFDDQDQYVVIGAQRDSYGAGVVKSAVGTSILLALAQVISDMVKYEGFKPRRSIVFASWSAGDYGAVGATEWLEGYATTLHSKAFAYINLDSAVSGSKDFTFSASPMLKKLLEVAVSGMKKPYLFSDSLVNNQVPFRMDDAGFAFLSYSGIPSVSFSFRENGQDYPHLGTPADTLDNLLRFFAMSPIQLDNTLRVAAEIAGRMAVRMTHDHELYLDYASYDDKLLDLSRKLLAYSQEMKKLGLGLQWIFTARGDFSRAANALTVSVEKTDLTNRVASRALNDRIMRVEYYFLSPYVSPRDSPLRHIFFGSGSHTVQALLDHLAVLKSNKAAFNETLFKTQLALMTWTIQGAANALTGDIWDIDNEF